MILNFVGFHAKEAALGLIGALILTAPAVLVAQGIKWLGGM